MVLTFTAGVIFDTKILDFFILNRLRNPYFASPVSNPSTFMIIRANIAGIANGGFSAIYCLVLDDLDFDGRILLKCILRK